MTVSRVKMLCRRLFIGPAKVVVTCRKERVHDRCLRRSDMDPIVLCYELKRREAKLLPSQAFLLLPAVIAHAVRVKSHVCQTIEDRY